jgi:hypothetical protein
MQISKFLYINYYFKQWILSSLNCATKSTMSGSMTWWYVTPSMRYSSHLMMLILYEHSPYRSLGKEIYHLQLKLCPDLLNPGSAYASSLNIGRE